MAQLALIVTALLWAYYALLPYPVIIDTEQSGGTVYFSVNRGVVLLTSDCVIVRWDVENIQAVYLNQQPEIGSGEREWCLADAEPTLTVVFRSGTQTDFVLPVTVLLYSPLTWLLVALIILVTVIQRQKLKFLIQHPRRAALVTGMFATIFYLFIVYLMPLSRTIATASWLDATAALADLLRGITFTLILFVIGSSLLHHAQESPPSSNKASSRPALWAVGAGTAIIIGGTALTVVAVNPLGMYFSDQDNAGQLLLRGSKTDTYNQLDRTPEIVILGSSRAFTLSPDYIQAQTGYTAYNMAVEGGRIEDVLIQARQMQTFPKVMLVEIQVGLPRQPNDIAARAPLAWLPYMHVDTALLTLQKRLEGLVNINQLAAAIYTARYAPLYSRQPQEWPYFEDDGFAVRQPGSASQLEQAILLDIGNIPAVRCDRINEASQADVEQLISIAEQHGASLVFYLSPWHPQYAEALLKNDPNYQSCYAATIDYMRQLSQRPQNMFFLDFAQLQTIGGTTDETGFYDSQHLTEANSNLLIDASVDTLHAAYRAATGSD